MCYRSNAVFFFLWTASVPTEAFFAIEACQAAAA
jgi:hypothetical protein